ncbi:hypothetical protein MMC07_005019 [Pseudocyphellaria aurata]|nr:hypothetical protein [Pseudocyphellaria aurata]
MRSSSLLLTFVSTLAAAAPTSSPSTGSSRPPVNSLANNVDVIHSLMLAPRAVDRIAMIPKDSDFVFDFDSPPANSSTTGLGGSTVAATRQSFPPLVGAGAAMTVGFLGPCGFNTPHTHPRSVELNILVEGRVSTQFVLENGARTVSNDLLPMQMTAFPQGALHTEFNPDCSRATFVAAFTNEDPGVQQEAQSFFGLDPAIVEAAVGNGFTFEGKDVNRFRDLIPKNVASGVEACLKKCNIKPEPSS